MNRINICFGLSILALVGCSGGSGGSGGGVSDSSAGSEYGQTMTAQFIDAPVKGLKLVTASGVSDQTRAEGKFSCKRGEMVSFSLGGLDLGYAACGDKIFVQDLLSKTNHYSWDQAAAILQTFAVNKGSYLDLSSLDQEKLDFSGISYDATPANLDLSTALSTALASGAYDNVEENAKPTSAVTVQIAKTEANKAFGSHISLSSEFSSVLAQLKNGGSSSIELEAELVSESLIPGLDEETCWQGIKAKSEVIYADGVYSYKINSAVSFNATSDLEADGTCSSGNATADKCETASRLPKPKIITGSNVDMIFSSSFTDQGLSLTEQNNLSIISSIAASEINFSGFYENKTTVTSEGLYKNKSLVCKYKVSGKKSVQTEQSPNVNVTKYNGSLNCKDSEANPISANVTAEVSLSDDTSGTLASIKLYSNGSLAWSRSSLALSSITESQRLGIFTDGDLDAAVGPVQSGDDFVLTKYKNDSMFANKLTLSIGSVGVHCDSYDGLTQE